MLTLTFKADHTLDLLWSLIGIEALYCSGNTGKAEQIFERTQIVLGPITDFKKRLKDMYRFRSRLIHGDLNIPSVISSHYDKEEIVRYNEEFYQATVFSIAILTTSLQALVHLDRNNLSFKAILA